MITIQTLLMIAAGVVYTIYGSADYAVWLP
jgi:hypothetical protein